MAWQGSRMQRWGGVLTVVGLVACGGDDGGDEAADTSGTQGDDDDDDGTGTGTESGSADETSPDGSSTDPTDGGSSSESGGGGCVDDCNPGGVVIWQAQWGTDDTWDTTLAASVGADGRVAIGGGVSPPEMPPTDGFVAVWDSEGTALFDEMLGERVRGAAAIGDDIVLSGETDAQALWLTRRDTAGAPSWDSVDESGTVVSAGPLLLLPGDELFTGGGTAAAGFVAHYDDAGMQLAFAETMVNVFVTAAVAIDTDVVVVADDLAGGYWLARMDPDGTTDWERMNAGTPTAMTITQDGELVITAVVATDMSTYTELHRWGPDGTMISAFPIPLGDAMDRTPRRHERDDLAGLLHRGERRVGVPNDRHGPRRHVLRRRHPSVGGRPRRLGDALRPVTR
jgi:hypothetical protein